MVSQCDDPLTPVDDMCAEVYTAWYARCFRDISSTGGLDEAILA